MLNAWAISMAWKDEFIVLYQNPKASIKEHFAVSMSCPGTTAEIVRIVFTGIRVVLVIGAILFMWQVRHPRTEWPLFSGAVIRPCRTRATAAVH